MVSLKQCFLALGLTLLAATSSSSSSLGDDARSLQSASSLKFTIIGDWGDGTKKRDRVATLLNRVNAQEKTSFTVSVGDNFYLLGVVGTWDPQFNSKWANVYTGNQPWYLTLGNHDWYFSEDAQLEYGKKNSRWIMPAFYYDKLFYVAPNVSLHLIFIDTEIFVTKTKGNDGKGKQLAWLEQTLSATTATWVFIVGHIPVYSVGDHGPNDVLISELNPLLTKYKVNGYISGHDHLSEFIQTAGTSYIVSGDGGRSDNKGAPNKANPKNGPVLWYNADEVGSIVLAEVHNASALTLSYMMADAKVPGYNVTLSNARLSSKTVV